MRTLIIASVFAAVIFTLTACGGGGSSSSSMCEVPVSGNSYDAHGNPIPATGSSGIFVPCDQLSAPQSHVCYVDGMSGTCPNAQ